MANKSLFGSVRSPSLPTPTTVNAAGGKAFEMTPKHALAQIAAVNCFNGTYYASASDNLKLAQEAALKLKDDPEFIAKVAVYSRSKGYMKDMPAFLTAMLAGISPELFRAVFPQVINNGKMLRNFVQIGRSGAAGKVLNLSAASCRKAIQKWFDSTAPAGILNASVGNDPTLKDILRLAWVRANSEEQAAILGYIEGATFDEKTGLFKVFRKDQSGKWHVVYRYKPESLPEVVKQLEQLKKDGKGEIPKLDFRLLDFLPDAAWVEIARKAPWNMTKKNLNTFARHGVFKNAEVTKLIASRLRDAEQIAKAKVFPYELMAAWKATETNSNVPFEVRDALQDAMEHAVANVPEFPGKVYICVDVSGSMGSPITGTRKGATSTIRCVDVAALFAAAVLRKNRSAEIIPFDGSVHDARGINPRDTVLTNAQKLAAFGGGATDCSAALRSLNDRSAKGDAVVFISDYESWVDSMYSSYRSTGMLTEWHGFQKRNPNAKLICIDLTPRGNSQVTERPNILQVGGFSDNVFNVAKAFIERGHDRNFWVAEIEKIDVRAGSNAAPAQVAPVEPVVAEDAEETEE